MKNIFVLIGILLVFLTLATSTVHASFFSNWGVYPAMGSYYGGYPYSSSYSYRTAQYNTANNFANNRYLLDYSRSTLDRTYNMANQGNSLRYGFESNSWDYNKPSPFEFYDYSPQRRSLYY